MNFGVVVLLVVSGWSLLSIVVALAVGQVTDQREGRAVPARGAESTASADPSLHSAAS